PEVGSYAEYKLTYPQEKVEVIARFAIVGKEKSPEGKELFWYEYQTDDPKSKSIDIVKMLISGDPQKQGNMIRMILKHNQDKPMELSAEIMQMVNAPMKGEKEKVKDTGEFKSLGKETLKTAAGSFECTHMQYVSEKKEVSDVWQTPQIPFFGLVKSVAQGLTMEIQKFGKDAKTGITEESEKITIPGIEEPGMEKVKVPQLDTLKKDLPKSTQPPK
ncbi:MAG: hypothetical protein Q8N71_05015, partial [candidate division Zixibacteria bacterium]|nr:hypothetical protein [candidate division Zixibacteria bacterium]